MEEQVSFCILNLRKSRHKQRSYHARLAGIHPRPNSNSSAVRGQTYGYLQDRSRPFILENHLQSIDLYRAEVRNLQPDASFSVYIQKFICFNDPVDPIAIRFVSRVLVPSNSI